MSDQATTTLTIDPTDPEVLWILGRPNFVCAPIAHVFQAAGQPIPTHCEDEQAAVIVWMLRKYLEHGREWHKPAGDELRALRDSVVARRKEAA